MFSHVHARGRKVFQWGESIHLFIGQGASAGGVNSMKMGGGTEAETLVGVSSGNTQIQ